jgi:hypothetical protein
MPAVNQDIELWEDNDAELDVALVQADGVTAMDLTGMRIFWALANAYDRSDVRIQKSSTEGGIQAVDLVGGTLKVLLDAADTLGLSGQPWYHELTLSDPSDQASRLCVLSGSAIVHGTSIR